MGRRSDFVINGKNVIIRPMEICDVDFIFSFWNDGEAMEYSGLKYGFMLSRTALVNMFKEQIESADMYPNEKMFIICRKDSLHPIGDISYRNWNKHSQSAEIGLEICRIEDRGKGYGSNAMAAFMDFMFRQLNLHRIELTTSEFNTTAHSLYYKLGFKKIGVIREGYYNPLKDCYTSALYMDILRNEWDEVRNKFL